jgi:hypothetical protein
VGKSRKSLAEAEKENGISHGKVSAVINGNRKSTGGYLWKWL